MKKKNTLETLIFNSGYSPKAFAEKVGVPVNTLYAQIKSKSVDSFTIKYACILKIDLHIVVENFNVSIEFMK